MRDESQIEKEHYQTLAYLKRERFYSYVEQIELVKKYAQTGDTILEVGKGNGLIEHILKELLGFSVTTLDINPDLHPDIVGNILKPGEWMKKPYDVVLAFEVLEHLPFHDARKALEHLVQVAQKYVLISIPDMRSFVSARFSMFERFPLTVQKVISFPRLTHRHQPFGKDHYWEIGINAGKHKTTMKKIKSELLKGFTVVEHFRCHLVPWHHYFVIQK